MRSNNKNIRPKAGHALKVKSLLRSSEMEIWRLVQKFKNSKWKEFELCINELRWILMKSVSLPFTLGSGELFHQQPPPNSDEASSESGEKLLQITSLYPISDNAAFSHCEEQQQQLNFLIQIFNNYNWRCEGIDNFTWSRINFVIHHPTSCRGWRKQFSCEKILKSSQVFRLFRARAHRRLMMGGKSLTESRSRAFFDARHHMLARASHWCEKSAFSNASFRIISIGKSKLNYHKLHDGSFLQDCTTVCTLEKKL